MKSLARWLATRTPEQLAALTRLPGEAFYGDDPRSLDELAQRLVSPAAIGPGMAALSVAGHQVLTAAARLAANPQWPRVATARTALGWQDEAIVEVDRVLSALGAVEPGPRLTAALDALDQLQAQVLVWPSGKGRLTVPGLILHQSAPRRSDKSYDLGATMDARLTAMAVALVAETLDVGRTATTRATLSQAIVAFLSEPANVRALAEAAPVKAREDLQTLADGGGLMGTHVFVPDPQFANARHNINLSYPDPNSVWLATHGLIVPIGADRAAVPAEVVAALTDAATFAFTPFPPTPSHSEVAEAQIRGEAQNSLVNAVTKVRQLLSAFDAQPLTPRKAGGLPVRDTKRLGKLMRIGEMETIFWIGLANHAQLIDTTADRTAVVVCPTTTSDQWLASSLPAQAAPLLWTWLGLEDIMSWWPFADEAPIAYGAAVDPQAVGLRVATLQALATLPAGAGCLSAVADPLVPAGEVASAGRDRQLTEVVRAAYWFSPNTVSEHPQVADRVRHTLYEASLLGVVAHGALTDVGRALLSGDEPALLRALADLLPTERTTARFQADMTVIVAGRPTAELARLLDSVAERESEGHAVVYRITPVSLRRMLDAGADATELLDQLAAVAEGDLPQPLRYQLIEASRSYGRVRVVESACCVRCDDESVIVDMIKAKALAHLGLRQIAPTVVISVKPPKETMAALRAAGFAPALETDTGTTVVERTQGRRATVRQRRTAAVTTAAQALKLAKRLLDRAAGENVDGVDTPQLRLY